MPSTSTRKKFARKKETRPCALCYAPLEDSETLIHDRHRGTKLGDEFLEKQEKPKLKPPRPKPQKKGPGQPKGSRQQFWLSPREERYVGLLADGYKTPEIAELCDTSLSCVTVALARGKRKTGARNNYQLVAMFVAKKLSEGESVVRYWRERKAQDQEGRTVGASQSSEATRANQRTNTLALA